MLFDGVLYLQSMSYALGIVLGYILVDSPRMVPFYNSFQILEKCCGLSILMRHMSDMRCLAYLISSECFYKHVKLVVFKPINLQVTRGESERCRNNPQTPSDPDLGQKIP